MKRFAETAAAIGATPGRLEKIALLGAYLRDLDDADLAAAVRFFTGDPLPARDQRTLAVGGRTIVAAAAKAWGVDRETLSESYRETGDLGAALGRLIRPPVDLGLFRETLTPARYGELLERISAASGKAAQRSRQILVETILGSCESALEATYVIKILTGELRIGLREGLIVDAIAEAFARDPDAVRRAAMAAGDIGIVAVAAKHDTLADVAVAYGVPIAPMLASPIPFGSAYREIAAGTWLTEDKYDGIRVQAHRFGETVRLFSRTGADTAGAFPEIVAALQTIAGDAILDGELIAQRDGAVLPFRVLQPRLGRKDPPPELLAEVPAVFVAFDILARDNAFLIDRPLVDRRAILAETLPPHAHLELAPWSVLERGAPPEVIEERFEAARARGNEGLIFKQTDSLYAPGRRGKWWLKLKRELATLDCVVVAVEWGHGKRRDVLSDYTFAVKGDDGGLLVIGKAYSGLTDAEIAEMTAWFQAHRLPDAQADRVFRELELKRGEIVVEPSIVVEIAFDIIQESRLHKSGFALRFPRIARLRQDKPASEIDTIARVRDIYAEMLGREGVGKQAGTS